MAEAPVFYNGQKIAQIGKAVFTGSSSPIVKNLPRTIGVAIFPTDSPNRKISVNCYLSIANTNKNALERLQTDLHNHLSSCLTGIGNLIVNENTYPNASPITNNFEIITNNEYLTFTVDFDLKFDMGYFTNNTIHTAQTREGQFQFDFTDVSLNSNIDNFLILHNYEVGSAVNFQLNTKPRRLGRYGKVTRYEGGVQSLSLDCFLVGENVRNMESYIANYLIGPLGKRGDLTISGKTYENCILTEVSNQPFIQSSMIYKIKFMTTLC